MATKAWTYPAPPIPTKKREECLQDINTKIDLLIEEQTTEEEKLSSYLTALKFELLNWNLPIKIGKIPLMLVSASGTTIRCKRLDRDLGSLIDLDFVDERVAFFVTKLFAGEIDGTLLYVSNGVWFDYIDEEYPNDWIPKGTVRSFGWLKSDGGISPFISQDPHPGCFPVLNNVDQYRYPGSGSCISFRFKPGAVANSTRDLVILDGTKEIYKEETALRYSALTKIASVYVHASYLAALPSGAILKLKIGEQNYFVNL